MRSASEATLRHEGEQYYAFALFLAAGMYAILLFVPLAATVRLNLRVGMVSWVLQILVLVWIGKARKRHATPRDFLFWLVLLTLAQLFSGIIADGIAAALGRGTGNPIAWLIFAILRDVLFVAFCVMLAWRVEKLWIWMALLALLLISSLPSIIIYSGGVSTIPQRGLWDSESAITYVTWGAAAILAAVAGWHVRRGSGQNWLVQL